MERDTSNNEEPSDSAYPVRTTGWGHVAPARHQFETLKFGRTQMASNEERSEGHRGLDHEGNVPSESFEDIAIPHLTHLQFLVTSMLMRGARPGRNLRKSLARAGVEKTGPAFYQLMARLEDEGYVRGWYEQRVIDSHEVRERKYELTSEGKDAWELTCDFYRHYMASDLAFTEI